MLNLVDVVIILLVVVSAVVGFKRGFFNSVISLAGFILILIIAFTYKDRLADLFFNYLPFFNFGGAFRDISVLNILLYEILAFLIICSILGIILKIIISVTNIFEMILKMTIVLGIPSKILGAIVGAVEGLLIAFIILVFVNQPTMAIKGVDESYLGNKILNNTPYLSKKTANIIAAGNELYELKNDFKDSTDADEFNKEALKVLLDNKIVKVKSVDILVKKDKINIPNIEDVLGEYR